MENARKKIQECYDIAELDRQNKLDGVEFDEDTKRYFNGLMDCNEK